MAPDDPDPSPAACSPVMWEADAPRSRRFGDIYFSREDGLAESRAVFLQGCGLPQAWRGRRRFTVAELGFGTGLNIAALLDLWRAQAEPGAWLHIFSVEVEPLGVADARRALSNWPEVSASAEALLAAWPGRAHGFHRVDLPGWNATFDLAVMDAAEALARWDGRADAWFLDGFAPAINPAMWGEEILAGIARRSAPGARAATFTVAGAVRRGLQAQGFIVDKRPGHGRKRERLEALLPGEAPSPLPSPSPSPRVAIIGAGIAGAALARAFSDLGLRPTVVEAAHAGAGASGNASALVTPRLDAGGGPAARLHAQAFGRAVELMTCQPQAVIAQGVLQLETAERDVGRFDRLAESDLFEPRELRRLDAAAAGQLLGEDSVGGALDLTRALVVEPGPLLVAWLDGAEVIGVEVARLDKSDGGWVLLDAVGRLIAEADIVCLAAGPAAVDLASVELQPVRGQVSAARHPGPVTACAWGGYLAPTRDGLLFGATHDRDDATSEIRDDDHRRNLDTLAARLPRLAAGLDGKRLDGRASVRATTVDRLPLAGEVPGQDGLWVLGGLGGRGFTLAPLLAEHIAAKVLGVASPLPTPLADVVDPVRFARRRRKRGLED